MTHSCKHSIYDPAGVTQSCVLPLGHSGQHRALEETQLKDASRSDGDPNVCVNCGHTRSLHFDPNAYVPGKCNYQYDLCSCRDFQPGDECRA